MAILEFFEHLSPGLRAFYFSSTSDMSYRLHTNTMVELQCVFSGKISQLIEGVEYHLQPGDLIVIRPGETHFPIVDLSEPYIRGGILFSPEIFGPLTENSTLLEPIFAREQGTHNVYRAEALASDPRDFFLKAAQKMPDERANILAQTILLLQQLGDAFRAHQSEIPGKASAGHKILQYIDKNLEKDLSVELLCSEFFISSASLGRTIKGITGLSVGQYITAKRLSKAKQLISEGHKPTQICAVCGYPNYPSFYRAYTKYFGCTPKEELLKPSWDTPDID